jgi:hypothetical protein
MSQPAKKAKTRQTMKALIKEEDVQSYRYKDIDQPTPRSNELLVKMEAVAICGSGKSHAIYFCSISICCCSLKTIKKRLQAVHHRRNFNCVQLCCDFSVVASSNLFSLHAS